MSNLLEFPPSSLPANIRTPPYVLFGIQGTDIFSLLPPKVPLNMALHFAPALKQWQLPVPTNLPKPAIRLALRTPFVGIDILSDDVTPEGLVWVICRMLQLSGLPLPRNIFLTHPSITTCVNIHRTWLALSLPCAGIDALHTHLQMNLLMGGPLLYPEMNGIWTTFPQSSPIVRAMATNFFQHVLAFAYESKTFVFLVKWITADPERRALFDQVELQFPNYAEVARVYTQAPATATNTGGPAGGVGASSGPVVRKKIRRSSGGKGKQVSREEVESTDPYDLDVDELTRELQEVLTSKINEWALNG